MPHFSDQLGSDVTGNGEAQVGAPYNVVHETHVGFDFMWTGKDPNELFEFRECIGKG